jgi:hypothetical protein
MRAAGPARMHVRGRQETPGAAPDIGPDQRDRGGARVYRDVIQVRCLGHGEEIVTGRPKVRGRRRLADHRGPVPGAVWPESSEAAK